MLGSQTNLESWLRIQSSRSRLALQLTSTLNDEKSSIPLGPTAEGSATGGTAGRRRFRLAILASHVIQYQAPLFRMLARQPEIELSVFFCSDWGAQGYHDEGFGLEGRSSGMCLCLKATVLSSYLTGVSGRVLRGFGDGLTRGSSCI